ncbi:hypothetical protein HDV57DRAFT_490215 [Trichoderma longibrachiatum]
MRMWLFGSAKWIVLLALFLSRRRKRKRCLMDSKSWQNLGSPDLMQRMMNWTTTRMAEVETVQRKGKERKRRRNKQQTKGLGGRENA